MQSSSVFLVIIDLFVTALHHFLRLATLVTFLKVN